MTSKLAPSRPWFVMSLAFWIAVIAAGICADAPKSSPPATQNTSAEPALLSSCQDARSAFESERHRFSAGQSEVFKLLQLAEQWRDAALQTNFSADQWLLTAHDYVKLLRDLEQDVTCKIEDGATIPSAGVHVRKRRELAEADFHDAVVQHRIETGRQLQRWRAELARKRAHTLGDFDLIYPTQPPRKVSR